MQQRGLINTPQDFSKILTLIMLAVLALMSVVMIKFGVTAGLLLGMTPLFVFMGVALIKDPFWGLVGMFIANYLIITIIRYTMIDGWSVMMDILMVLTIFSVLINRFLFDRGRISFKVFNGLTVCAVIWVAYCCLELLNPTSMVSAWLLSRGLIFYFLMMALITFVTVRDFKKVEMLMLMLSVFTLIGFAKGLMQKYIGFDSFEWKALNEDLGTTHLLNSGTRYFSIYASAGIFGVVMGHAFVVFMIMALYTKKKFLRIYFVLISIAGFYGLLISGTRGALAVPFAGFFLFILLSKKLKLIIPTIVIFVGVYVFLAMTYIGQSNATIRRMRTLFDPNEPSLMVRLENQKKFAKYLTYRPFGEGLGLSGVEAQSTSNRFTTSLPTDSWYVKIWVETGIVGLVLHIAILIYMVIQGSFLILFRIKDDWIKGVLTALLCGVFGIMVSSYGNLVLGQFPVVLIVYMSLALVFMGPYFDKLKRNDNLTQNIA